MIDERQQRPGGRLGLTVAFLAAGAGNLVFHLAAVRSVGPVAFADFGVITALMAIATLPLAAVEVAFGAAIARAATRGTVSGDAVALRYRRLVTLPGTAVAVAVGGVAVWQLHVGLLQAALLVAFLHAAVHLTLGRSLLIGGRHWEAASVAVLTAPACRFVALLTVVAIGHADSATALVGATVAGEAAAAAVAMHLAARRFDASGADIDVSGSKLAVAFASLAPVALLAGTDVILARVALPATEVGRIAAASNVARAGLYLPQAVAFAALPDLSVGSARRASTIVGRAVAVLTVLVGAAAVAAVVVGRPIAGLLLGDPTLGGLLAPLLVVAAGVGLTHLVVTAMLARGTRWSLYPLAFVPLLGVAGLLRTTAAVVVVAGTLTVGAAVAGLVLLAVYRRAADRSYDLDQRGDDALAGHSVSIVVPSYRPGPGLEEHVRGLARALDRSSARAWEIVLVSDGCPEGSADRVRDLALPGVVVLAHADNRGKGHAVRSGVARSRGDVVGFIDADGDIPPEVAVELAARLAAGEGDAIVGDKTHPRSVVARPWTRRVTTFCWGTLVQLLFGVPVADTQTGVKVWRGDLARRCAAATQEDGFAFDLEMLVLTGAAGVEVRSGPVRLVSDHATSSIRPTHVIDMAAAALRLRRRHARTATVTREVAPTTERDLDASLV